MLINHIQEKGILAKLLEKTIKVLLKKECNKIRNLKIDIIASSIQIIKGKIEEINITAEDINYKNLLFDKIELEADKVDVITKGGNIGDLLKTSSLFSSFAGSFVSGGSLASVASRMYGFGGGVGNPTNRRGSGVR